MDKCPICTGKRLEKAYKVPPGRHLDLALDHFDIFRCLDCGYLMALPLPDAGMLTQVYDRNFHQTSQQNIPLDHEGTVSEEFKSRPVFINAQNRIKQLDGFCHEGRLLDVGCGKGVFVLAASEVFEAEGIDFSQHAVESGKSLGLKLRAGDFMELSLSDEGYDVVTMWDVLACLHDPSQVFTKVHRILKNGGYFIATYPVGTSLAGRILKRFWPMMIPPISLGYHNPETIEILAGRTGFKTVSSKLSGKWIAGDFVLLKAVRILGISKYVNSAIYRLFRFKVYLNTFDVATVVLQKVDNYDGH